MFYHSYTDRETAFAKNLAYVTDEGKVVMKGDDYTWLDDGVYRNRSVHEMYLYSVRMLTEWMPSVFAYPARSSTTLVSS